ncbi:MAG: DEAD/DEAH box helicase [Actinomycetota bacterium]
MPSFADLGVPDAIVAILDRQRIREPFAVQEATIPDLLAGRDVVGRAPTGSGKTLAFGIPLIATVPKAESKRPSALVLAPTRELADQIATDLRPLADASDRTILAVYGGVGLEPQINKLRKGIDVLVATPGRLEDLIERRAVQLGDAEIVVIDEADRMADMGFMPVVKRLLDQTAEERQTVLYSATLDGDVGKLIQRYQQDPKRHEVGPASPDLKAMEHFFWELPRTDRVPLCASVIATFGPTIVFTRTRHGADRLGKQLGRLGVKAAAIHGNRSQAQRTRALDDFARGKAHALVATDVAARGIHVDGVECVVHFDPVDEDSAYVHRSGRTARAGAHGKVISFVDPGQVKLVKAMKRRLDLPQEITAPPEVDGDALPELPDTEADDTNDRAGRDGRDRRDDRDRPNRQQSRRKSKPRARKGGGKGAKSGGSGGGQRSRQGGQGRPGGKPGTPKKQGAKKQGAKKQGGKKQGGKPKHGGSNSRGASGKGSGKPRRGGKGPGGPKGKRGPGPRPR